MLKYAVLILWRKKGVPANFYAFCISVQVILSRKPTVHIYTYFLPSGLMVMVSWISFAVRVDAVPGR